MLITSCGQLICAVVGVNFDLNSKMSMVHSRNDVYSAYIYAYSNSCEWHSHLAKSCSIQAPEFLKKGLKGEARHGLPPGPFRSKDLRWVPGVALPSAEQSAFFTSKIFHKTKHMHSRLTPAAKPTKSNPITNTCTRHQQGILWVGRRTSPPEIS